jgi:hypothetical protein
MAFDFPSSPTVGQQYSPVPGTTYTYNGYGWTSGGNTLSISTQQFIASGIYTPRVGMQFCIIECLGGGAGGNGVWGAGSQVWSSGGGGSGGYSRKLSSAAAIGASQVVTIGANGAGGIGAASPGVGGAGGDTSVGSLCIAKGAPAPTIWYSGGAGAVVGTGDVIAAGAPGGGGASVVSGSVTPGNGGSSAFGGGGGNQGWASGASFLNGLSATNYGSGGGGASTNDYGAAANGGNGSPGIVIITEYVLTGSASVGVVTTVAGLPTAGTSNKGLRAFVTDATSVTFHAAVVGGGSNNVGVVCDGTGWYIG